jgi:hypothetical protein
MPEGRSRAIAIEAFAWIALLAGFLAIYVAAGYGGTASILPHLAVAGTAIAALIALRFLVGALSAVPCTCPAPISMAIRGRGVAFSSRLSTRSSICTCAPPGRVA